MGGSSSDSPQPVAVVPKAAGAEQMAEPDIPERGAAAASTNPAAASSTPPVAGRPSSSNGQEANLQVSRDWHSTAATFVAGGVAGAASRTLTAPLDRIKIIVQEGYLINAPKGTTLSSRKNARLIDVAKMIFADGGAKSFWRGNLINCLKAGPEFALVFSFRRYFTSLYEDCIERERLRLKAANKKYDARDSNARMIRDREREEREAMTGDREDMYPEDLLFAPENAASPESPAEHRQRLKEQKRVTTARRHEIEREASIFTPPFNGMGMLTHVPRLAVNCAIGACAGLGAQSLVYPLEVIKTRVVVSKSSEYQGGSLEVIKKAYKAGGIGEFYRGFTPNMVGIVVYRGLEMGIYSSIQQSVMLYRIQVQHKRRHEASLNTGEVGIAAMVASVISQTVSYPFNVVRTRLQTQGSNGREKMYTGMGDCIVKMVRTKGVQSLFSGLMANYLKAVPASTCAFMVFEKTQTLLIGDD